MSRLTRRTLLARIGAVVGGVAALDLAAPFIWQPASAAPALPAPTETLRLGANFSPLEASYMDLDAPAAFDEILSLNLDFIRLGAYWNELEQREGKFDWGRLERYLEKAARRGIPVILTLGMKAPVWPEYHLPWWVHESVWLPPTGLITRDPRLAALAHAFTRAVAERYAAAPEITVLQVENEPFEPVLTEHGWTLDEPYLRQQVAIVRSADRLGRPILLTAYVGTHRLVTGLQSLQWRLAAQPVTVPLFGMRSERALIALADIVGLDVYPNIGWKFFGLPSYLRAIDPDDYGALLAWRDAVLAAGKRVMIAECQAKPWEPGDKVYRHFETPSFRPHDIAPLVARLASFGFSDIALWGVEHWLWHRDHGDPRWWREGQRLLERRELPAAAGSDPDRSVR
ncbi:MAG: beta-galactosidase [Chloroflexota bacterium]|nr:beta-galactosidase [Dehalococcoidia bacterium]MDW8253858.1 beta-galactosidase [Chloroflexota bacterium]